MATAKPALKSAPPPPEADEAPAPKRKSKLWLIVGIVVAVLVLAGGGAAAWYFLRAKDPAPAAGAPAAAATADKKSAEAKPPTFVTLEPFTVNLQQENGDHFLQTGIVVQVADSKAADAMKTYMPIIRSKLLLLLSSKAPSELASLEGKKKLVAEIIATVRDSLPGTTPDRGIENAYISSFVIQ
jgi:flagellar FliL protein